MRGRACRGVVRWQTLVATTWQRRVAAQAVGAAAAAAATARATAATVRATTRPAR